jgi:ABC-type antimicrobial peptide transport system permease subunit
VAAAPALDVHLNARYTLLAIPAAMLLCVIASLPPAWRATHASPAAAIRPPVAAVRRSRVPHRVSALALANVLRSPGRSAVGALSLALGVASLSLLFVITVAFRGTVTGTVLGDAITVQVRATDYIAAALTVLLGAATVADVVYVNIRERSAEFALLAATGWPEGAVARLAGYEAVTLGLTGGVLGAGAGLGAAAALTGGLSVQAWLVGVLAAGVGLLVTVAAAVLPVRSLRSLPIALLLAEE